MNIIQSLGQLSEALDFGSTFCQRVVDIAVEAANSAVLLSLNAAERLSLDTAAFLQNDLTLAADTSCTAAYRDMQTLLDREGPRQTSSSSADLGAGDNVQGTSRLELLCVM